MMKTTRVAMLPFYGAVMALALGPACSDDDDGPAPDAMVDAAMDAAPDASPDAAVPTPPCVTPLVTGEIFDLDPDGPDTQIHVNAAFDGESVWVVYSLPDASSGFDVYGLRLDCDGTHRVAPFRINTTDHNDLDPVVAVRGDRAYVAWQTDTGSGQDNMQLLLRTYALDGTPVMSADQMLRTTRHGQPVPGNTWMPAVAALPTGFAIAGARAVDDASGFQAFVQRLADDGTLTGATVDASFFAPSSQTAPALAAAADGALYLAFELGMPPDWEDQVVHTRLAAGATTTNPLPPALADGRLQAAGPNLAVGPEGRVYLAFGDADTEMIVLTDGATFSGADAVELGDSGRLDFAPTIAPAPGGGAVAWFRNWSGFSNELWVQRFAYDGTTFTLGTTQAVTAQSVPPYAPTITHVVDDVFFIAWSEGDSPDFRVKGTFLRLP